MPTVDQRVVQMQFDNKQFEAAIATTLTSLDKLNKSLQLQGSVKGLENVNAAAQKMNLKNVENSVQSIADRFSVMGRIATGALENIGAKAVETGHRLISSLTVDPLRSGFQEYETNLNSIQTILANTQAAGTTLKDVTGALEELNHYSDQTIYNFSEMARNIGTFTAAGVDLKTSTAAIKGIANLAALSGSNSQQASTAMYQLSQAISSGKVSLEDWNSVVNAGMGGTVFQRALAMNAEKMGTLNKGAVTLKGSMKNVTIEGESFRNSIMAEPGKESWLTSEVLTQTLAQFTGDLSDAELAAQGFSKAEIMAIQAQAQMAKSAATEVKTLTQLFSTFKEQLGSGWAKTWEIIFGDFTEAKGLFTGVSNVIGGMLQKSSDSRNQMLSDWKDLGGRTILIEAIGNAFNGVLSVLKPIREAFSDVFPDITAKRLLAITERLRDFTERLSIGAETSEKLKKVFTAFFMVVELVAKAVGGVVLVLLKLVSAAMRNSDVVLDFAVRLIDFVGRVRDAANETGILGKAFERLKNLIAIPLELLKTVGDILKTLATRVMDFFGQFEISGEDAGNAVKGFGTKLSPLAVALKALTDGGDSFNKWLASVDVGKFFGPFLEKTSAFFSNIGQYISGFMQGVNWELVFAGINTGAFAGLAAVIGKVLLDLGSGPGDIIEGITDTLEGLTDTLGAMQNTLRATTLLQIAIAIGILAVSADKLSKINAADLNKALKAMAAMMVQLLAAIFVFSKLSGVTGFIQLALSLILFATAIRILTGAVKELSEIEWEALVKGLKGTAVLLLAVAVAAKLMSNVQGLISTGIGLLLLAAAIKILVTAVKDLAEMEWEEMKQGLIGVGTLLATLALFTRLAAADKAGLSQGLGILLIAVAIKVLYSAVKDFATMSWGEMTKGLIGVAGGLTAIAIGLKLMPPSSLYSAAAVLVVAASLKLIADAVEDMGNLSWKEIAKGLTTMSVALVAIALALKLMPPTSLMSAVSILLVAATLYLISDALKGMAEMSWEEIAKSLIVLAGALGIIAVAVNLMVGALPGAAALLIVSASLLVISQVLQSFAEMSLAEIGTSLLMLAGVFVVLGAAALILAPLAPVLIAVGLGITLLGIGVLAAGAGVLLFATGLTALAVAGTAATAVIVAMITALVSLIPVVLTQLGLGIVAFAKVIATAGPEFFAAMTAVLGALLDAIKVLTPKIVDTLLSMLLALLRKLAEYVPKLVDAGSDLVVGVLNGFARKMPEIVTAGVNLLVKFIEGIAKNIGTLVQAAIDLIIAFINGLSDGIRNNSAALGEAGANLGTAIIEGIVRALGSGLQTVINKAKEIAKGALNAAKSALGISSPSKEFMKVGKWSIEGMVIGLDNNAHLVEKSAAGVGQTALDSTKNVLSGLTDILTSDIDTTHTITPVLDLTSFKKDANYIRNALPSPTISVGSTYSQASAAQRGYLSNQASFMEDGEITTSRSNDLTFNQYITSPKAISNAEIYRQTRSQLSKAKEALPKP